MFFWDKKIHSKLFLSGALWSFLINLLKSVLIFNWLNDDESMECIKIICCVMCVIYAYYRDAQISEELIIYLNLNAIPSFLVMDQFDIEIFCHSLSRESANDVE